MNNTIIIQKSKIKIFLLLMLSLASASTCDEDEDVVPYVYVNFEINLSNTDYFDLNAVGNAVMVNGGYKGIIIYRKSLEEFTAFDRCCTYDVDSDTTRLELDGARAVCPHCGAEFSLSLDGMVLEGPAALSLKQYQVSYSKAYNRLYVTN